MDRMQLIYACLQAKFPGGYRSAKGAAYTAKLKGLSDQDLKRELFKLNPNHSYFQNNKPV